MGRFPEAAMLSMHLEACETSLLIATVDKEGGEASWSSTHQVWCNVCTLVLDRKTVIDNF